MPICIYVTDHSADSLRFSEAWLANLYSDIHRDGIDSVRYDWRWRLIEPRVGAFDRGQLARYGRAKLLMEQAGLELPCVILSSLPTWAAKLYETDKLAFFLAWRRYAERVRDQLADVGGSPVKRIQILNEINFQPYSPVDSQDLPELAHIVRDVFQGQQIEIMVTLLASNRLPFGAPILEYLSLIEHAKASFDVIGVDYYPGVWHLNLGFSLKRLSRLKSLCEEFSRWGKSYELSEVGYPSRLIWGGEAGQAEFYSRFFAAFEHLLSDLRADGVPLPGGLGLYSAIDEPPSTIVQKLVHALTPWPEHDFGLRRAQGSRKLILQPPEHSRLSRLILDLHDSIEPA